MFLDAWLRLSIFGPVVLLVFLFAVFAFGFALSRAVASFRRLLREAGLAQAWPKAALVVLLCLPIAALIVAVFVDTRLERHLVLDLGKPQRALLTELARCAGQFDSGCDSARYSVSAAIILPEGRRLHIRTECLHWSQEKDSTVLIEIRDADANALSLQAAHQLLMAHVTALEERPDAKTQQKIDRASTWFLKCCEGSTVYSETLGIQLTRHFGLQFYKNVDEVAVAYVLRSPIK
jgi:hypothetical protein